MNDGNFDGASGWVRFDVGAGADVGFAINAFRFVAALDGLFEVANVNVYNGSFFVRCLSLVACIIIGSIHFPLRDVSVYINFCCV